MFVLSSSDCNEALLLFALTKLAAHSDTSVEDHGCTYEDSLDSAANMFRVVYTAPGLRVSVVSRCFAGDADSRYTELGVSGDRARAFLNYVGADPLAYDGAAYEAEYGSGE